MNMNTKNWESNTIQKHVSVILLCALLACVNSCTEENNPEAQLPTLTTLTISNITSASATSGGNITDDGGAEVTARGVCWSTNASPTVSDSKTMDGTGTGTFASSLNELAKNTTYHVRAYAINKVGTAYGNELSFMTTDILTVPILLATTPVSAIGQTSAVSGGIVSSDGGAGVTMRGVCWSVNHNPTTDDAKTTDGPGTGSFTSTLSGLMLNTKYYVRAYATNNIGTGYGEETYFTTLGSSGVPGDVVDADGNAYKSVTIGSQIWMTENLKTTTYSDGTPIAFITDSLGWLADNQGAYTWYRNDSIHYSGTYGALYNWYAVNTGKLCPTDWHVPSEDEWITLQNYLIAHGFNYDGTTNGDWKTNNKIAKALSDITTWESSGDLGSPGNTDFPSNRNATGFNARAGGFKDFYGSFGFFVSQGLWFPYAGLEGSWWTSSEEVPGAVSAFWHQISTYQSGVLRSHNDKYYGLSIRCVKN
ncbi:major paralogous domain-containing protein [Chryseolinea serpens]|uniref:Major paralogous domain-containing protein n=2 Tax=Chryseolinea serpens TaxID=947013 RepID=A0A1M5QYL8_9BACT|nr:major paralogous domain-containing protein [Chryseolinea serpens]